MFRIALTQWRHYASRLTPAAAVHTRPAVAMARVSRPALARGFQHSAVRSDRFGEAQEQIKQGTEYLQQGNIDMAMTSYHKSVQAAPTAVGYFNIGVCYFQMGKHKDALNAFQKSLDLQPNQADAHTNMASSCLMLKDVPTAIRHLEQASNFNPLDGEIQYNLGMVYEATGNLDGAKTRLERASMLGISRAGEALEKLAEKMSK